MSLGYTAGAYDLSVEWMHDKLDFTSDRVTRKTISGNQMGLKAPYHF